MIDFLKYRLVSAVLSVCIIAVAVGVYFYKERTRGYTFIYSVDFTGGTQVLFRFNKPMSSLTLRGVLDKQGWPGAITREFSSNEILVRVQEFSKDAKGVSEKMKEAIKIVLPDYEVNILQSEYVGPEVGAMLRWKSMITILFALLLMLLYIAVRFWSFGFAIGAVTALFHDALMMLACFLIFDREISTNVIVAILAVLGYSINDTIVIFSRIRDNLKKMSGLSLYEIVNTSLNQTIRRTLLTSISTGLTVGSMFVLGGEALRNFSLAILIGIVVGTYSSIYIASPLMMLFYKKKV